MSKSRTKTAPAAITADALDDLITGLMLTRAQAAELLGTDLRTLFRWLSNESPVPRAAWLALELCRRLGGVPDDLMPKEK